MRDLWIQENDLIVATHGRSFWILDDIAPLREVTPSFASGGDHLFTPAVAYRVARDTNSDTPIPPDESAGENPPDGAIIDYYLPHAAAGAVILEIVDAHGQVVRRFASTDKAPEPEEKLKKQLIPLYWLRPFRSLPSDAGMHRWIWDLHYAAPTSTRHEYPIAAIPHDTPRLPLGPNVLPGNYTVRLTVDGKSYSVALTVKTDPRIKISAAALEKKHQAEVHLASLLSEMSQAVAQANSLREQLKKLGEQSSGAVKETVEATQKKLPALLGAPGGSLAPVSEEVTLSRVNGQANTLYGEVWQADAEPTISQMQAISAIDRDYNAVMKRWNEFKSAELSSLNRQLHDAKMPEIQLESDIGSSEPQSDEE
jgi:hypothetical protein